MNDRTLVDDFTLLVIAENPLHSSFMEQSLHARGHSCGTDGIS